MDSFRRRRKTKMCLDRFFCADVAVQILDLVDGNVHGKPRHLPKMARTMYEKNQVKRGFTHIYAYNDFATNTLFVIIP